VTIGEDVVARGVITADGETLRAKAVISNLNPKLLFNRIVPQDALPEDFRERISRYKVGSGTFRMNVALSELPRFTCKPEPSDHLTAGIIIAPSMQYMERAYDDARKYGWSREPIVEMLIPSTLDDSLAPPGKHVASLFCQHVQPELSDGRSWDDYRDQVADLMIATVDKYAPGFEASVLGRQIMSPARFGADVRLDRGRHHAWRPIAGSIVQRATGAGAWRLSGADQGSLYVRLRHASGRRG
jgi:phytoene dehydrogenase-like protein